MSTPQKLLVLAAAAAAALVGLWRMPGRDAPPASEREVADAEVKGEPQPVMAVPGADPVRVEAPSLAEPEPERELVAPRVEAEADEAFSAPLTLLFVDPRGEPIELGRARVALVAQDGDVFEHEVVGASGARLEITLGVYRLRVDAEGLRHLEESIDASMERGFADGNVVHGIEHRVVLWPDAWIPVRVRTPDGRPFEALADDLGWEPKRLFVDAFAFATRNEPIDPQRIAQAQDGGHAEFRPPKGWQNVRIGDDVIGSLELVQPAPFYVGLWVHGEFAAQTVLEARDEELVLELSRRAILDRLGRVELQLVDRASRAPVVRGASATLKAETSAHRRHDLSDREPDGAGRIVFERVVPGLHELTIERGGSFIQRELSIAPGETVELGDIAIGQDAPIRLTVLDEAGEPVRACVEIAPYVEGAATQDLYHPNLHRTTDHEGRYDLPVPETLSIVRVRPLHRPREAGTRYDIIGSRNLLVDPDAPPASLDVIVRWPVEVRVEAEAPWREGDRLEVVETELELVVERWRSARRTVDLVPGAYRFVRSDARGEVSGAREVTIDESVRVVRVP